MLFRQLEYFVAVAQERHFARAAEKCYGTLRLGTVPTASTTASLVLSAFYSDHPLVKVQIHSRLSTTELYRRLRDFELDAAIMHSVPEEAREVDLAPLYEERSVLLSPADMLPAGTSTLRWPDAAQLPLALLTRDMRDRQVIDTAFADHAIAVSPQVETDSVASLLAQVATGDWACIVPHTWLWTTLMAGDIRVVELVDPVLKAEIAVATSSAEPGSPMARAFSSCAQKLALNEFFDTRLLRITGRQ